MVLVPFAHAGMDGRGALPQLGPNAAGTVLLIASLLSFTLFVGGQGRWRHLGALAQIPILAGLLATESRGAWLGWAVGVVALAVLVGMGARHMRWHVWAAAGVLAAAVALAGAWQPDLAQRARSMLVLEMNRDRLLLWQASWQMFEDHPWWGVGFGAFSQVFPAYRLPGDPNVLPPFAHNLPLSMAVETGVLGLLTFAALAVAAMWIGIARRLRDPAEERTARIGAIAAFVGLMAHQMVDGTLQSFHIAVGFWFLVAVMVAPPGGRGQDASAR
jgi:O-antigen ligase